MENNDQDAPEQEQAEDVVSIITVFGAHLYGNVPAKPAKRPRVQPPEALQPAEPAEPAVSVEPQESEESVEEEPRKRKTPFKRTAALDGQLRTFKVLMRPIGIADQGAEAVVLSGPAEVQPDKRPDKRRRNAKQGQASERSVGQASA